MAVKRGTIRSEVIYGTSLSDTLYGSGGNDKLYGYGANDTLYGDSGQDTLDGGSGNDRLFGGTYSDRLIGGTGIDLLDGGSGNDVLTGGTSDDAVYGQSGNDTFFGDNGSSIDGNYYDGGTGIDLLTFQNATRGVDVYLGYRNGLVVSDTDDEVVRIENLYGSNYGDTLTGSLASNTIKGLRGSDLIYGSGGADLIYGNENNDTLYGDNWRTIYDQSPGSDTLYGGDGDDVLYGGGERDILSGGTGRDGFAIQEGEFFSGFYNSGDLVTDFVKGTDRIVIDEIPFTRPGIINFQFVSNGNFTAHASNIIQVSYIYVDNGRGSGVNTLVLADFDGTVGADAKLELRGQFTLSSSDFSFF